MSPTQPLPGGLAEPLHLLEPSPYPSMLLAGLLLLAAFGLLLWLGQHRRRAVLAPAGPVGPPPPPVADSIAARIREIHQRYRPARKRRRGCHELAATLRHHLDRTARAAHIGPPFATLTAREIGRRLGDRPVARLLDLLADLQFSRRLPSRDDFDGACALALEVVGEGRGR